MKSVVKSFCLIFFFLIFLCITIDDKPIFTYIYNSISPVTTSCQELVEGFFNRSIAGTKSYSRKIFDNSVPKIKDSVKSKLSSQLKNQDNVIEEKITEEDRSELDALIKNH